MRKNLTLSIIVPCNNGEETIVDTPRTLQVGDKSRLEVIFVDDGSPDRSSGVASNYLVSRGISHRVLSQSQSGLGAARDFGIRAARG